MRIRPAELAGIRAGTIDVGFRRWDRPRVVVGTRMRTAVGLVLVVARSDEAELPAAAFHVTEVDRVAQLVRAAAVILGDRLDRAPVVSAVTDPA